MTWISLPLLERMPRMKLETRSLGPEAVLVALSGRLDMAGVPAVEDAFGAASSSAKLAIVDLTDTPFIASIGIRLLLANAKILSRRGGRLIAFGCVPQVDKVLRATGLDQLIPLLGSQDEALAVAGIVVQSDAS